MKKIITVLLLGAFFVIGSTMSAKSPNVPTPIGGANCNCPKTWKCALYLGDTICYPPNNRWANGF
jgi:hypothetical protein